MFVVGWFRLVGFRFFGRFVGGFGFVGWWLVGGKVVGCSFLLDVGWRLVCCGLVGWR